MTLAGEAQRERTAEIDRTYAQAVGRMRRTFDRTPVKRRGPRPDPRTIDAVIERGREAQEANIDRWLAGFERRHPLSSPNLMGGR